MKCIGVFNVYCLFFFLFLRKDNELHWTGLLGRSQNVVSFLGFSITIDIVYEELCGYKKY